VSSELRRRRGETEEREEKEKGPASKAKVTSCCAGVRRYDMLRISW